MPTHFVTAILAAVTLLPLLPAQTARNATDPDRKATSAFVSLPDSPPLAGVTISYTPPVWRDSYDGMLGQLAGNYTRLGKGWWTTLDTIGAIELGGKTLEAGSYYLGLAVDRDGAFSLLVFDSKQTMKKGLLPGSTPLYRGDAKADLAVPMTFQKGALAQTVAVMEIEVRADEKNPSTGQLSIRWGKHQLTAAVKFVLATAEAPKDADK